MRNYLQIVLLSLALQGAPAFAIDYSKRADRPMDDGFFPGIMCHECRDPMQHPEDYAALIYNGFFGDEPWLLGWKLGLPIRIYYAHMDYVLVWFEGALFDTPSLLPNLLDIRMRLPNGVVITLTLLQEGPDMTIGEPASGDPVCAPNEGSAGNEDDDYEEREEIEEIEFDEPVGHVEIVDPDEDGEFPDWEEEL